MSGSGCFSVLDIEYILHVLHKVHGYKITLEQGLEFFNDLWAAGCGPGMWPIGCVHSLQEHFCQCLSIILEEKYIFLKDLVPFEKLLVESKHVWQ